MASGGGAAADPFLTKLNSVKDKFAVKFAEVINCHASEFKVIVSSSPSKGIHAERFGKGIYPVRFLPGGAPQPHYYTVTIMLAEPRVIDVSDDLAAIIEKVTITGEPISTEHQAMYDEWKENQNEALYKEAKATGNGVDTDQLTELCHNIVQLLVIPPQLPGSSLVGAVLGSWFYYTDKRVTDYLKQQSIQATGESINMVALMCAVRDFVYSDIQADFMMLFDVWRGYNTGSKQSMDSKDVKSATRTKTPKTPAAKMIVKKFVTSPNDQSTDANRRQFSQTGYYASVGFTEHRLIKDQDNAFLDDPTVAKTKLVALSGEHPDYKHDLKKLKISIRPVNITFRGKTFLQRLEGEPAKVIGRILKIPKEEAAELEYKMETQEKHSPFTFYGLVEHKPNALLDLLKDGGSLKVNTYEASGGPRSSKRKPALTGAFADLAIA